MNTLELPLSKIAERTPWITAHIGYVKSFFRTGEKFSNDKLHDIFGEPPHCNHWGVLTEALRKDGFIQEAGRVKSKRDNANGRKITLWEVVK